MMVKTLDSCPKSLDPRTLAKLSGLQLRARRIVEGYVAGLHRSPYHGFSIEFAEHREYAPGDDLRYLDWKVFGRTDKFYLKQYEDETNLICYLVVDVSESMGYGGPDAPLSKLEYAQCLASSLAWLVLRQQDAVGLVTLDEKVRDSLPPTSQAAQLKQLINRLESAQPGDKTGLGRLLKQLAQTFRRRGIVVIISDLFDDVATLAAGLKQLQRRRHDTIVLQVLDSAEQTFPFQQPALFKGLEGWPDLVTDPRLLRRAYLKELDTHLRAISRACREAESNYRLVRADEPIDRHLSALLAARAGSSRLGDR